MRQLGINFLTSGIERAILLAVDRLDVEAFDARRSFLVRHGEDVGLDTRHRV